MKDEMERAWRGGEVKRPEICWSDVQPRFRRRPMAIRLTALLLIGPALLYNIVNAVVFHGIPEVVSVFKRDMSSILRFLFAKYY